MTKMVKANELKQGDKIISEQYSSLWKRMERTECTVMEVTENGGDYSVMAMAQQNARKFVVSIFVKGGAMVEAA
jgi:co-chaperonin GroES (HSP10)